MSMPNRTSSLPIIVFILLLVYMSLSYTVLGLPEPYLDLFIQEDRIFESITSLGFLITAVILFMALHRSRKPEHRPENPPLKQLSYLFLALIFLVGAGEEISWGQRIFEIATPELMREVNVQHELNLHNLTVFEGKGSLLTVDTLFTLFAFTFILVIPVVAIRFQPFARVVKRLMPVPNWGLGLLFLANFILAKLAKILFVSSYDNPAITFIQGVQKIKEGNYGVLFALVAAYITFVMLKPRIANINRASS